MRTLAGVPSGVEVTLGPLPDPVADAGNLTFPGSLFLWRLLSESALEVEQSSAISVSAPAVAEADTAED